MKSYTVRVLEGTASPAPTAAMEPEFVLAPEDAGACAELMQREPVFHRPEFGTSCEAFERIMAPEFWEVGASGRRYSREFALKLLANRYNPPTLVEWQIQDFCCQHLGGECFLATYTLLQGERLSRRASIWRRSPDGWQILYHQGTLVT